LVSLKSMQKGHRNIVTLYPHTGQLQGTQKKPDKIMKMMDKHGTTHCVILEAALPSYSYVHDVSINKPLKQILKGY